jgi:hypothetical protein
VYNPTAGRRIKSLNLRPSPPQLALLPHGPLHRLGVLQGTADATRSKVDAHQLIALGYYGRRISITGRTHKDCKGSKD